jgi:hypothetical protein
LSIVQLVLSIAPLYSNPGSAPGHAFARLLPHHICANLPLACGITAQYISVLNISTHSMHDAQSNEAWSSVRSVESPEAHTPYMQQHLARSWTWRRQVALPSNVISACRLASKATVFRQQHDNCENRIMEQLVRCLMDALTAALKARLPRTLHLES